MKPLAYLTTRSIVNGCRRALTSGRRMLGLIFAIAYYIFFFVRPFERSASLLDTSLSKSLEMPPLQVLHAVVFFLFAILTLLLAVGTFSPRASFRPADADVLFATPISPKVVLVFRIIRDYLATLLFPLLLALLSWRPMTLGIEALFRNMPNPSTQPYVYRAWTVAWILMSLSWVCIGYAASLFVGRSDLKSGRNRVVINTGALLLLFGLLLYVAIRLRLSDSWPERLALAHDPILRAGFFTGTFATMIVMGPLEGNMTASAVGGIALACIIVAAMRVAMTQVGWLYDQAAAKGFDTSRTRTLQMKGDTMAIFAERARHGKLKAGRFNWLSKLRVQGPAAILWREVVLLGRGMWGLALLMSLLTLALTLMPVLIPSRVGEVAGFGFLAIQGFSVFLVTVSIAQAGFIEMLRRVDMQKPLPFTAAKSCFYEIVAKALPAIAAGLVGQIVMLVLAPGLWAFVGASFMLAPAGAILFSAALFLVTVLFPDVEDPTQRAFRGLITILTLAILTGPILVLFALSMFLFNTVSVGPLIAGAISAAAALGLASLVAVIGGSQYASYNPSE